MIDLAVLDTNVLVSGLYYPRSQPGRVLDAVQSRELVPVFDQRVLAEYTEVLARPKFRAFYRPETAEALLGSLVELGLDAGEVPPYPEPLPDDGDKLFVEIALATGAIIVTGNTRHFPPHIGIDVLRPADVVRQLGL